MNNRMKHTHIRYSISRTGNAPPRCLLPLLLCQEEFEDTKGVIGIRKSKEDRQHNGQNKKHKWTNNDLQNTTQKTKDRVTQTSLKSGVELRCSGRASSSCSTSGTRRVNLFTNPVISHAWGKDQYSANAFEIYSFAEIIQIIQFWRHNSMWNQT